MSRIVEGVRWRWAKIRKYIFLICSFRNGITLAICYRNGKHCNRAITWSGTVIEHPDRSGLAETLLEIWYNKIYTERGFYTPRQGDVVIDAGANVGIFSVWLAAHYPTCRVFAFEPFRENFDLLVKNLRSARIDSVTASQVALGAHSGLGSMVDGGGRSLDHRLDCSSKVTGAEAVSMRSFAQVVACCGAEPIALFKIDIEGSEYDLFESVTEADLRRVERFAIEYHNNIRPGVLELLLSRLGKTLCTTIRPASDGGYGMLYATLNQERDRSK